MEYLVPERKLQLIRDLVVFKDYRNSELFVSTTHVPATKAMRTLPVQFLTRPSSNWKLGIVVVHGRI